MQAEVELHPEIAEFEVLDAEAPDDQQISDIESLTGQDCDALIISPNTTATLTPAVEEACERGVPVIVFDRGVKTDCPVTFIKPIGGYAFGADAAEFLVDEVAEGGKVLALRILPGVDVLETRFGAAQQIFEENGIELVGAEFTEGDAANTKSIVADYIQREGEPRRHLDGRRRHRRWPPSRRSRTTGSRSRRSPARTSRTSSRSGRRRPDGRGPHLPDVPVAHPGHRRRDGS